MDKEHIDKFNELLREDIAKLEAAKKELEKKIEKLINNFHVNDIQKLDKLSNEISSINHTINHLYSVIGSMYVRLK
jgi:septation ring formation regulator EzrA